jgi:hypothetical protein
MPYGVQTYGVGSTYRLRILAFTMWMVLDLVAARDLLHHARNQLLRQHHQVIVVSIRL